MPVTVDAEIALLTEEAVVRLAGISRNALRRYQAEGLVIVHEVIVRQRRRERLYDRSTVQRVRRIRSYETIGINLAGIDIILRLLEQLDRQRTG